MTISRTIPPSLEAAVMEKAGEGLGTRAISDWLRAEHHVAASHQAVNRFLRGRRIERREAVKAVVSEHLARSATRDLDRLEELTRTAMAIARKHEGKPDVWARVTREARSLIEAKLKAQGLDETDEPKHAGVRVYLPPESDD